MTDSHWGFILAAYAVTALVIGGMTLKILLDYRRLQQELGTMAGAKIARDDAS
jgi:heme exporter protein CcmD